MSGGGMGGLGGGSPPRGPLGGTGPLNWSGYSGTPSWDASANGGKGGWGTTGGAAFNNQSGGTGGNSIASNALQQVTGPEEQQAQNAQNLAGYYQGMAPKALGITAPTIANASQAQLNQSRGQLAGLGQSYMDVAQGKGPMGHLAQNEYQQALGQSLASNVAAAHSAMGGAIGGAGAMRAAQEAGAQTTAGAAGQSAILAAQQQQAGLAGAQGAYGQLGQMNLSQYQTAQQIAQAQAQIRQQQTGQNEGFFSNLTSAGSNQQQIANQATQSLGGLGVQAGLGEAGTAVGAQNATTNMIGMGANLGSAGLGAVSSSLTGMGPTSDANAKTAVQSEGGSATTAVGTPGGGTNEVTTDVSKGGSPGEIAGGIAKYAGVGAGTGSTIGTAIFPGIGTLVGGAAGAIGGGIAGGVDAAQNGHQTQGFSGPAPQAPSGQGGYITSDERLKFAEQNGRASMADQFLEHLHPYSYQYKNPGDEPRDPTGGRYLGVMAQDLQRVPEIGHQLVSDTQGGRKVISMGAGLSAALAGLGRLDERLTALESPNDDVADRFAEHMNPTARKRGASGGLGKSVSDGLITLAQRVKELEGRR